MFRTGMLVAIRATLVTLVLTGLIYPLVTTAAALTLFPSRARGSLVTDDSGRVLGSELIAQPFAKPGYLQPRPSAAGEKGYDAAGSSGSNLGPTSKALPGRAEEVRGWTKWNRRRRLRCASWWSMTSGTSARRWSSSCRGWAAP